jgi:hypothetical protein
MIHVDIDYGGTKYSVVLLSNFLLTLSFQQSAQTDERHDVDHVCQHIIASSAYPVTSPCFSTIPRIFPASHKGQHEL